MNSLFVYLSFLFLAACAPLSVFAQDAPEPPVTLTRTASGFTYEKVIELPSVTKEQAYIRVKKWIGANLKTNDNNVVFDDVEKNNIGTSATLNLVVKQLSKDFGVPHVNFKISISF